MKQLNIHYLQHVPFEDLGCIEDWIQKNGHHLTRTRLYEDPVIPDTELIDWLIILGGPMSVHDENIYHWLKAEKSFIRKAIETNKTILGICLGAQLLAEALGARTYTNPHKEIGWFNVSLTEEGSESQLLKGFEQTFPVFHWHEDTFDLPDGSSHLLQSEGCKNQAFSHGQHIIGLQFHFEVTRKSMNEMLKNGKSQLTEGKYIQAKQEILAGRRFIEENNKKIFFILDSLLTNLKA